MLTHILLPFDSLLLIVSSQFIVVFTFLTAFSTIRNKESKGSSIRVNIAHILHGTIYSILAHYMRTVQSKFRHLIIFAIVESWQDILPKQIMNIFAPTPVQFRFFFADAVAKFQASEAKIRSFRTAEAFQNVQTQSKLFEILLNQTEIRFYFSVSD